MLLIFISVLLFTYFLQYKLYKKYRSAGVYEFLGIKLTPVNIIGITLLCDGYIYILFAWFPIIAIIIACLSMFKHLQSYLIFK